MSCSRNTHYTCSQCTSSVHMPGCVRVFVCVFEVRGTFDGKQATSLSSLSLCPSVSLSLSHPLSLSLSVSVGWPLSACSLRPQLPTQTTDSNTETQTYYKYAHTSCCLPPLCLSMPLSLHHLYPDWRLDGWMAGGSVDGWGGR